MSGWATLLPERSPLSARGMAERWQACMDIAADSDGLTQHGELWWDAECCEELNGEPLTPAPRGML